MSRQDVSRLKHSKADLRNARADVSNLTRSNRFLREFLLGQWEAATSPDERDRIEAVLTHATALAAGRRPTDPAFGVARPRGRL